MRKNDNKREFNSIGPGITALGLVNKWDGARMRVRGALGLGVGPDKLCTDKYMFIIATACMARPEREYSSINATVTHGGRGVYGDAFGG